MVSKIIDGKRYSFGGWYTSKDKARDRANRERKQGRSARVVPNKLSEAKRKTVGKLRPGVVMQYQVWCR